MRPPPAWSLPGCILGLVGFLVLLSPARTVFASGDGWSYWQKTDLPDTPFSKAAAAVKNRPIGGGFALSLAGSLQHRFQKLDNRRDFTHRGNDEDVSLLARERISLDLRRGHLVRGFLEVQDAHEFWRDRLPGANPNENALDIYQAFGELGLLDDVVDKPALVFRVGRQELVLGGRHLFSENDWLNIGQSFDLIRTIWRPDGFQVDAFAGWPVVADHRNPDSPSSHVNLAGINLQALGIPLGHHVEGALVYKWNEKTNLRGERGILDAERLWTLTGLANGNFLKRCDYGLEVALQTGERGEDNCMAWSAFGTVGYTQPFGWRSLRMALQYSQSSGDKDPRDGISQTFDPLFADQFRFHGKLLVAGPKNLEDLSVRIQARLWRGGLLEIDHHTYHLLQATDAFYQANGRPLRRNLRGQGGREAGREIDFQITHSFHENLSISGGLFLFDPGRLFSRSGNRGDDNASSVFFMVRTSF